MAWDSAEHYRDYGYDNVVGRAVCVQASKLVILTSVPVLKTCFGKQLGENPLREPPASQVLREGAQKVVWRCRQIGLQEQRGTPPEAKVVRIGPGSEITTTDKAIQQDVWALMRSARESGELNGAWMGIHEIDPGLIRMKGLRALRLPNNNISELPNVMCYMPNLLTLLVSNNQLVWKRTKRRRSCLSDKRIVCNADLAAAVAGQLKVDGTVR